MVQETRTERTETSCTTGPITVEKNIDGKDNSIADSEVRLYRYKVPPRILENFKDENEQVCLPGIAVRRPIPKLSVSNRPARSISVGPEEKLSHSGDMEGSSAVTEVRPDVEVSQGSMCPNSGSGSIRFRLKHNDSYFEERIMQHLAAAAMGRAYNLSRRENLRNRSSGHPQFLALSIHSTPPHVSPITGPNNTEVLGGKIPAVTAVGPTAPVMTAAREEEHGPFLYPPGQMSSRSSRCTARNFNPRFGEWE
eukprot:Gb_23894 [translate_table: standard]